MEQITPSSSEQGASSLKHNLSGVLPEAVQLYTSHTQGCDLKTQLSLLYWHYYGLLLSDESRYTQLLFCLLGGPAQKI